MTKKELQSLSDKEIIDFLIKGNNQVVKYLFYEKYSSLFGYLIKNIFVYKISKDELINEFYLFLSENNWAKIHSFDNRSKLVTWISIVAVRFSLKIKNKLIVSDDYYTLNAKELKNISENSLLNSFIANIDLYYAINKLKNPRDRFIIMALEIEGQSIEEVAKSLNITIENLYNVRKRAKEKLSNILTEYKYV